MLTTDMKPFTAEQLLALPRGQWRYELIRGELKQMSPAGHTHGFVAMRFAGELYAFLMQHPLGRVYAAETGFKLESDPDTVRAPDASFVSADRLAKMKLSDKGFFPGAPDLAVEVLSPSDSYSEVESKTLDWLDAGTRVVVVVDPRKQTASVYRSRTEISILSGEQVFRADDLLPGFELPISRLFH